jgi:ABC-type bacteriocin/lantibiotic exporter with double-glycine peptidase domain
MNFFSFTHQGKLYNAVNYQRTLDRVFRHAWIAIVVVFVIQLVNDLILGFYSVGVLLVLGIYLSIVGIGAILISILFLIYSHKLYRRLQALSHVQKLHHKNIDRVLCKSLIFLCLFVVCSMKAFVFLLLENLFF